MSVNQIHLNKTLATLGANTRYEAGSVAWNDNQRGVHTEGGHSVLSCIGRNITDVCISARVHGCHKTPICQYIRPPNMDETLGVMSAKNVLMMESNGESVSLQEVLDSLSTRAQYMGYNSIATHHKPDEEVVVRFQTSWVPLQRNQRTQIVPTHYSYQTVSNTDPRNLLLLGTPQGLFVHSDAVGPNHMYAHSVDRDNQVTNRWFEVEANRDCLVGGEAFETDETPVAKRARTVEMGVDGMGSRSNCFVTVSIPNTQRQEETLSSSFINEGYHSDDDLPVYRSLSSRDNTQSVEGVSYAARLAMASESCGVSGATGHDIDRAKEEPIVVTVLTYNTIEVPEHFKGEPNLLTIKPDDVERAVRELDRQYSLVEENGGRVCKLSQLPTMLHKLATKEVSLCSP